jgi:hypothetical protein
LASYSSAAISKLVVCAPPAEVMFLRCPFSWLKMAVAVSRPKRSSVFRPNRLWLPWINWPVSGRLTLPASSFWMISSSCPV